MDLLHGPLEGSKVEDAQTEEAGSLNDQTHGRLPVRKTSTVLSHGNLGGCFLQQVAFPD